MEGHVRNSQNVNLFIISSYNCQYIFVSKKEIEIAHRTCLKCTALFCKLIYRIGHHLKEKYTPLIVAYGNYLYNNIVDCTNIMDIL